MTMQTLPVDLGQGGGVDAGIGAIIREIRGLTVSIGAGAAAAAKVNVAAIRIEDTILSVIRSVAGVLTDVTANYTIFDTRASGTLTAASVANNDTCVVNGNTYTAKTTLTGAAREFLIGGTNAATATNLAAAINAYESRWDGSKFHIAAVTAVAASAVVTIKAVADGTAGNALTLTGTAVRLAASGAGTLAGGTATGGVVSDADHSATSSLIVTWYNKQ